MGLRVRLKASVDISRYGRQARVVLQALKTLRDDPRRQRIALVHLRRASDRTSTTTTCTHSGRSRGADFEVVDASPAALKASNG